VSVKYKPILIKIGSTFWNKHLTKLHIKCPLYLKCASTTLGNLKWQIESSTQYTYVYILIDHWIATTTTGSHCLKNRQPCSKLHCLNTTCLKFLDPARTKIWDVDELKRRIKNEWTFCIRLLIQRATSISFVRAAGGYFEHNYVKIVWLTAHRRFLR